jgi:hypothetical protein
LLTVYVRSCRGSQLHSQHSTAAQRKEHCHTTRGPAVDDAWL